MIYLFESPEIAAKVAISFQGKYDGFNGVDFGLQWNNRDELYYQVKLQFGEDIYFYRENSFCWHPYPHSQVAIDEDSLVRMVVMDTIYLSEKEMDLVYKDIENPTPINETLKKAIQEYKKIYG